MCSMSVLCPLCAHTSFNSIDALRHRLINAANGPLACPICHELFLGLDKLTIHLFSHTTSVSTMEPGKTSTATTITTTITLQPPQIATTIPVPVATLATTTVSAPAIIPASAPASALQMETPSSAGASEKLVHALLPMNREKRMKKSKQTCAIVAHQNGEDVGEQQSAQQQQQPAAEALATCDICELTFRNADLRDMHVRLVHQSSSRPPPAEMHLNAANVCHTALTGSAGACEPDFKCHLCAKRFKLKVHLKVHLKVVHLVGLPHNGNNLPKLTICDRIRHKETQLQATAQGAAQTEIKHIMQQQQQLPQQQQQQQQQLLQHQPKQRQQVDATPTPTTKLFATTAPTATYSIARQNFLPTLAPSFTDKLPLVSSSPPKGMLELHANRELVSSPDVASLDPNLLLVFNATPVSVSSMSSTTAAVLQAEDIGINIDGERDVRLEESFRSSTQDTNPKIWECDVCTKSFTTKYFLKKHKRLHTGEMPYTCEICARTFTFQQSYHKHLLYHSDDKPHVCATCGRAFKELSTLHNHERIHSGEKPFKCEVCGKCFRQRVSFLVHTRIHTGIMPYKCEACQRSFRYKVSQRTHKCLVKSAEVNEADDAATASCIAVSKQTSEQVITAFLESTSVEFAESAHSHSPASNEIAAITSGDCNDNDLEVKPTLDEVLLSKTIDDIVVESCHKLGIGCHDAVFTPRSASHNSNASATSCSGTVTHCCNGTSESSGTCIDDCANSPLQKLQHMRIYSPQLVETVGDLAATDPNAGASNLAFTHFLLDDTSNQLF